MFVAQPLPSGSIQPMLVLLASGTVRLYSDIAYVLFSYDFTSLCN